MFVDDPFHLKPTTYFQTTMVVPIAATAARAVGAASNAGATALGIGIGKSDMDLSRDLFKQQMRQTKRLWTAD